MSLAMLAVLLFAGCSDNRNNTTEPTPSPPPVTAEPTPTPTPVPDFSDTDFTGTWYVSGVVSADGKMLSETEITQLDTFTLELLRKGVYFVYREDGVVMGQGEYSVTLNQLICRADGQETVYLIQDENTLHGIAADDSITILSRFIPEPEPEDEDEETDVPDDDTPVDGE